MTADEAAARLCSEFGVALGRVKVEHSMGALREIAIKVYQQVIDEERNPPPGRMPDLIPDEPKRRHGYKR